MISQFFAVMQSKFKTEKGNKALEEIGEVLADYSKLLDYAAQFLSELNHIWDQVRYWLNVVRKHMEEMRQKKL